MTHEVQTPSAASDPAGSGPTRGERPQRRSPRLRTYFAGLIALFIISAAAGIGYVRVETERDARRAALRDARFAADGASKLLSTGVNVIQPALHKVANDPDIGQILAEPSACSLGYAPIGAFETGHFDVLRPDGSVVCSSRAKPAPPKPDYVGQDWLRAARVKPLMLAPVNDPVTGQPAALFAEPFRGGILIGFVDLRPIGPKLASQFGGARNLQFLVTSADGNAVVASSDQPERWTGTPLTGTAFMTNPGDDRPDLSGRRRLFASVSVQNVGWKVYAGADRATAFAAVGQLYRRQLMIIVIALLVVLAATALVQRRISRPISQLERVVRHRTAGERAAVVVMRGPAEVQRLAKEFDHLVAAVTRELAERERAEEAARTAAEEARAAADSYRLLYEGNPQPMWIYEADTLAIFEVNEAAVAHYGYSREEFLTLTIRDLHRPEDIPTLLDTLAGTGGTIDRSGSWVHRKKDGSLIEAEIASHPVQFQGRSGRLVLVSDVTERERLQRQLNQTQRLESLGQLAGGVAHDFNNLLSVIVNYAAFVNEEITKECAPAAPGAARWEAVRADVEQIEKAGQRATRLTRQLLAFARREVVHPEVLNINDVVTEVEVLLQRTLGEHIELRRSLQPELWPVLADPGHLEQVLLNLAVNARDAMGGGGLLSIETENVDVDATYAATRPRLSPGRYVRLRVSDTGAGMDAETLRSAFEPFFTTKPKGEGTGLGLATIYGIVTQAGGDAQLYSEPGLGTTFSALFPTSDQASEPAAGPGPAALDLLTARDESIGLLLTDVVMPGMQGKEVADRITALQPQVPVLFMSGYAESVLAPEMTPAGTMLLDKPFSEEALLRKVEEALTASPAGPR